MATNINPERLAAELLADADVIRSLRESGDVSSIVRPVDVRFVGDQEQIGALRVKIGNLGWKFIQTVALGDGSLALDAQREQTTDAAAIRVLTEEALRIETENNIHYDGWGTVAKR
jgi:regulator of RNase E activity RraB